MKSNIGFVSNLYPVTENLRNRDLKFLSQIKDPFCLEKMKSNPLFKFTSEQDDIFSHASCHCIYADDGDYPFGSIKMDDGTERVVCKCLKKSCDFFASCRSDLFQ